MTLSQLDSMRPSLISRPFSWLLLRSASYIVTMMTAMRSGRGGGRSRVWRKQSFAEWQ